MLRSLQQFADSVPVILRLVLGATHVFAHGLPKVLEPERWESTGRAMANLGVTFAPTFWGFMAGATELVGGVLLIIGLLVRPTSAVLLFVLFVAALQNVVTAGSLAGGRAHPIDAGVGLVALMILGAGTWSLDRKLGVDAPRREVSSRQPAIV